MAAGDSSPRGQPESEPDGPQVNSRLGPVRAGDSRTTEDSFNTEVVVGIN